MYIYFIFHVCVFRSLMPPPPAPPAHNCATSMDEMQIFHLALLHLYCPSRKQSPGEERDGDSDKVEVSEQKRLLVTFKQEVTAINQRWRC